MSGRRGLQPIIDDTWARLLQVLKGPSPIIGNVDTLQRDGLGAGCGQSGAKEQLHKTRSRTPLRLMPCIEA